MTEQTLRDLNQAFDAFEALEASFDDTRYQLFRLIDNEREPGHLFDALDQAIGKVESSFSRSVNRALTFCGLGLVDGKATIAKASLNKLDRELQEAIRTSLGYFDGPAEFKESFESTWSDFTESLVAMPLDEIKRSYLDELRQAAEFLNPTAEKIARERIYEPKEEFSDEKWDSLRQQFVGEFDCNRLSVKSLSEQEVCEKIAFEYKNDRVLQKLLMSPEDNQDDRMIEIGWKLDDAPGRPDWKPKNCPFPKKYPPIPEALQHSQAVKIVVAVRAVELRKAFNRLTIEVNWDRIRAEFAAVIRANQTVLKNTTNQNKATHQATDEIKTTVVCSSTKTFSIKEICDACGGIDGKTLSSHGRNATDKWAKRGQKDFRFDLSAARAVVDALKNGSQDDSVKAACEKWLSDNRNLIGRSELNRNHVR